jgi:hypothetical protein
MAVGGASRPCASGRSHKAADHEIPAAASIVGEESNLRLKDLCRGTVGNAQKCRGTPLHLLPLLDPGKDDPSSQRDPQSNYRGLRTQL